LWVDLNQESMAIPKFTRDEYKEEINPMEWLRLVKDNDRNILIVRSFFFGEAQVWWMSIDFDTRWNTTWE
jgi:hypothetical protein